MVILNLGGESEDPGETRRPIPGFVRPGWLIQGDFLALPIRSSVIDEVRGHMVPLLLSGGHDRLLAQEAFRVLRPGGGIRLSPTLPAQTVLRALAAAGFVAVKLEGGSATGVKP